MKNQDELNEAELEKTAGGYDPYLVRLRTSAMSADGGTVVGSWNIEDGLLL